MALQFGPINEAALAILPSLVRDLFPHGKPCGRDGREFKIGDIYGTPGESLSINLETGQWSDFATKEKGGDPVSLFAAAEHGGNQAAAALALAERLGIHPNGDTTPKPAEVKAPSEDWTPMVPPSGSAPSKSELGTYDMLHVYRDANGMPTHYVRRLERSPIRRKKHFGPLTYGCLNGRVGWHNKHVATPAPLFGLEHLAERPDAEVVIHEGEKKSIQAAARFPDYVHVAWSRGAESVRLTDWTPLLTRKAIIWPDNDQAGHKAAGWLSKHLPRARMLKVRDLPEGHDAGDVQPDTPGAWLRERLPTLAEPDAEPALPLVWLDDIRPVLTARDFVQGLLVEGALTVVYGDSHAGKTFWTTDLALHVAAGKPWNGRRVDQGGVVYCVLEGGDGFRNRVSAWREANPDARSLPFAAIPSSLNLLDPDADTPRLIDTIKAAARRMGCPVKLVVVDTLARALAGGNENAPEDMGALVINSDTIRRETGANVVFVHHSGKDAAKGARGHSSLRAAVDTEVEVVSNEATGIRTATVVKQRDIAKIPAIGFRLDTVVLGRNEHGEEVTTCMVAGADAADAAPRTGRINEEAATLLREIQNSLACGEGGECSPEPGMPLCPTVKRPVLQAALIRRAWLLLPELPELPKSSGSGPERVPDKEHKRLWQRLNHLKLKGLIGFNRADVWLTKPVLDRAAP